MPSESPLRIPDSELALRARLGDEPAFAELLSRYEQRVYNLCFRLSRNHADALDIAQTAYVKAWRALARYESRSGFFTWLYRIVVNQALSHRRSRRGKATSRLGTSGIDDEPVGAPEPAVIDDPSRRMELEEMQRQLEKALAALDDEFRAPVVLRDIEELDYSTIAEILGVPVGTVKSRIFRGRSMLRELLGVSTSENPGTKGRFQDGK